jgi:NACHT domain
MALIMEAREGKSERRRNALERHEAGLERTENREERHARQKRHMIQQQEKDGMHVSARPSLSSADHRPLAERCKQIRLWFNSCQLNEPNSERHRQNNRNREDGTCDWLTMNTLYSAWQRDVPNSPILWLCASPGFGKSIICSRAVQLIQDSDPNAAVVYHFYQHDQRFSAGETLRILAGQLLECYGKSSNQIDDELYLKSQRTSCSPENVQEAITMLVKRLPKTYFFIDGLDEEVTPPTRWTKASTVLDFLILLSIASPDTVRIWFSSQSLPCISDKLGLHPTLDVKDQVRADVMHYLSHTMSRSNPDLDEEEKEEMLWKLQNRAEGNFLWARLMIKALQKQANNLGEMKQFIDRLPEDLDDYYRRIFSRIEQKSQQRLAWCVFFF